MGFIRPLWYKNPPSVRMVQEQNLFSQEPQSARKISGIPLVVGYHLPSTIQLPFQSPFSIGGKWHSPKPAPQSQLNLPVHSPVK